MSLDEKRVPDLRFKGFSEDWEQRKLGELMNVVSVKRIHQSDWRKQGVRFLRARDIVSLSKGEDPSEYLYISQDTYDVYTKISGKVKVGDLLVTGVGTIGVPMLITEDKPLYFKDGNVIWFKNEYLDGKFLYFSFIGEKIQKYIRNVAGIGTVGTYTISNGKKTPISFPSLEEQKFLGELLNQLEDTINLHQRKIRLLNGIYEEYTSTFFPQKNENIPKIRFSNFGDNWGITVMGNILKEFSIKSTVEDEYKVLSSTNSGMEIRKGRVSGTSNKGYKIINTGSLVLSPQNLWLGNININNLGTGLVSPSYKTFKISKVDGGFLEPQLRTRRMLKNFENVSTQGASIVRRNLDIELFNQIVIKVPSNDEKYKISELFNKMMSSISILEDKLSKLQSIKKIYLEKMFL